MASAARSKSNGVFLPLKSVKRATTEVEVLASCALEMR